jgi:hypothetical protein
MLRGDAQHRRAARKETTAQLRGARGLGPRVFSAKRRTTKERTPAEPASFVTFRLSWRYSANVVSDDVMLSRLLDQLASAQLASAQLASFQLASAQLASLQLACAHDAPEWM